MPGCSSHARPSFTAEEDRALLLAMAQTTRDPGTCGFWKKIRESVRTTRSPQSLAIRFQNLAEKLHEADLDNDTKLKLYKKYKLKVAESDVEVPKNGTDIVVGEDVQIIEDQEEPEAPRLRGRSRKCTMRAAESAPQPKRSRDYLAEDGETESHSLSQATTPIQAQQCRRRRRGPRAHPLSILSPSLSPAPDSVQNAPIAQDLELPEPVVQQLKRTVTEAVGSVMAERARDKTSVKQYLIDLLSIVSHHRKTNELDAIEKRIFSAIQALERDDEDMPLASIHSFLDIGLKIVGR